MYNKYLVLGPNLPLYSNIGIIAKNVPIAKLIYA